MANISVYKIFPVGKYSIEKFNWKLTKVCAVHVSFFEQVKLSSGLQQHFDVSKSMAKFDELVPFLEQFSLYQTRFLQFHSRGIDID